MAKIRMTATLSLRSNFATNHLRAAVRAARGAHDVEQANDTAGHGQWFDDMLMLVPVAVVMAASALESNANEILKDVLDGKVPLTNCQRLLLTDLFNDRSGNALDKYRRLALLLGKEPSIRSDSWVDAKLLVSFRNSFMHFKPAWDREKDTHDGSLVRKLKTKIAVYSAYRSSFMFPYGFMTYDCAKWSVQSVLCFSERFNSLVGLKDRFSSQNLDISLP
jgi:hypothetical protein